LRGIAAATALIAFSACTVASAHTFCVSTSSGLQQALTASGDGGAYEDEDNLIRVVTGTYLTGAATSNGPFFLYSPTSAHLLTVFGGYEPGCNSTQHPAAETILDGHGATAVLALRGGHMRFAVTHLTMQNGNGDQPGAGLQVNYLTTVNTPVNIDHVIIRNNHSSVDAGGLYVSGAADFGEDAVYVTNALITGNSSDANYGGVYMTGFGNTASGLANSTIARNSAAAVNGRVGGVYCGGSATCNIANTVAWNNSNIGIFLDNAGALTCDDYGTLGGTPPAFSNGNLSLNPSFVDANNDDFHLTGASPLLGICPPNSDYDVDGLAFPNSGKEDVGAFEETVFVDGFDD
jgi:hypothetical protein